MLQWKVGLDHVADEPFGNHAAGLAILGIGTSLGPDLDDGVGFAHRVQRRVGLLQHVGHGFFAVGVLARVGGQLQDLSVGVVGGGDDQGVHLSIGQNLFVMAVGLGGVALLGLCQLHRIFAAVVPEVADGDEPGVEPPVHLKEPLQSSGAAPSRPDDSQVEAIVDVASADDAGKAGQGQTRSGSGRTGQKGTAVNGCLTHDW